MELFVSQAWKTPMHILLYLECFNMQLAKGALSWKPVLDELEKRISHDTPTTLKAGQS